MKETLSAQKGCSMPRDLILGTAGHIDHGKTSLVKALTGIDCDRLPEEKARGITIDIGFARLDLGDFRLGQTVPSPGRVCPTGRRGHGVRAVERAGFREVARRSAARPLMRR